MKTTVLKTVAGIVWIIVLLAGCGSKTDAPQEKILARIGDRTISVNEYIRRAEYTIRPSYCKQNSYIHKKIILNSLIAEKLLALEAGEFNELMQNDLFNAYIEGRREQAMRQWYYYKTFYEPVAPDDARVNNETRLSGRTYEISYFTISDSLLARQIKDRLGQGERFDEVYRQLGGLEGLPRREIGWQSQEMPVIHDRLYTGSPKKHQIIGPVEVETNVFTFMKIEGWTERRLMLEKDVNQRKADVFDRQRSLAANARFQDYVGDLMKGKRVRFNEETFKALVNIVGPYYMKTTQELKQSLNQNLWGRDDVRQMQEEMGSAIDAIRNNTLLEFDDQVWTVNDYERELSRHPLVFRKQRFGSGEFAQQFKLAVVDLIRDKKMTEDLYKKGVDKAAPVQRTYAMWRDNMLFLYERNRFLNETGKAGEFYKNQVKIMDNVLNPYIETLQKKYSQEIEIDTDSFESIDLTRIDSFMLQSNVPYPILVPNFPVITTRHQLDYGSKMELEM